MILERDISLEISRATLDGWVLKAGELLIPMVAAMRRELIIGTYIQADETPVDVQMRKGRGKNHQAYSVDCRTISSGSIAISATYSLRFSIRSSRVRAAISPIFCSGCRTVVAATGSVTCNRHGGKRWFPHQIRMNPDSRFARGRGGLLPGNVHGVRVWPFHSARTAMTPGLSAIRK